jgi:hypothetical protein
MKIAYLMPFILLAAACSQVSLNNRLPANELTSLLDQPVEEETAFQGWKKNTSEQHGEILFSQLKMAKLQCDSTELTPTNVGMEFKTYYNAKRGIYKDHHVSPEGSLCLIRSRGKKVFCLKSDVLLYVVISDLYQDKCGNYYRGYKEILFQKSHENMGTLFSPGRTMYQNPKSEFEGDMMYGDTYPVNWEDFLFLTEATEEEKQKLPLSKQRSIAEGFVFDSVRNIYRKK